MKKRQFNHLFVDHPKLALLADAHVHPLDAYATSCPPRLQSLITKSHHHVLIRSIFDKHRDKGLPALTLSCTAPFSGRFLSSSLLQSSSTVPPSAFSSALRHRLGILPFPIPESTQQCRRCGTKLLRYRVPRTYHLL